MSERKLYGLCELARALELPESTTRYYRDVFAPHVPVVGTGRKRRYPEEALPVLRFIVDAFANGWTREEIKTALSNGSAPQYPVEEEAGPPFRPVPPPMRDDRVTTSLIEGEREQRELMWRMIRELSRFGDAIERQHYILSELVEHVFHDAGRCLPAAGNGDGGETVVDADVVPKTDEDKTNAMRGASRASRDDVEALKEALEAERDLVNRLRQSKLEIERRAASAEAELERTREQAPGLLRRLFERDRGR